ncbi:diacylglycerol kinase [Brucella intermedia M86]|uniref:Diacylglycerol kinase n=1 Tax=Brucella intermedia M86 TaxID=1234597 RepID=M5JZK6_9HYPH|nr:diacylglycerol kinase [Brucella intermedia M86]
MLPAPEKIMLATLDPTAAAGCNFLGIQLHFAPWLLKKGRNTQERILHFSSDQLNYSLHAKASSSPHAQILPRFRRNNERQVNFVGFREFVNNLLILWELTS